MKNRSQYTSGSLYSHLFHCNKYGTFTGGTLKQCASVVWHTNTTTDNENENEQQRTRRWRRRRRKKESKNRCISYIYHRIYYPTNRRTSKKKQTNETNTIGVRARSLARVRRFEPERHIGIAHLYNSELLAEPPFFFFLFVFFLCCSQTSDITTPSTIYLFVSSVLSNSLLESFSLGRHCTKNARLPTAECAEIGLGLLFLPLNALDS